MPTVDALRARFFEATGSAFPRTAQLIAHPRLYQAMLDMEAVGDGVPARVGPFRRTQLLAWDRDASTWEAWDTVSGHRLHMVIGRWTPPPREAVLPWTQVAPTAWVSPPLELSLADLLPDIGEDPLLCAQVLVAAVRALPDPFGVLGPSCIVRSGGAWVVSGYPGGEEDEGVAGIGRVASLFGHHGEALAELEESPQLSPETVEQLLRTELADRLVAQVHRLRRRPLLEARQRRVAGVRRLADRLARAVRPPEGRGCLSAAIDGSVAVLEGDGDVLRGGIRASVGATADLPVIWRRGELDGHAVRPLLRLWSGRRPADEERRSAVQAELAGDDRFVEAALAFLRLGAHLRVDRMLLARL